SLGRCDRSLVPGTSRAAGRWPPAILVQTATPRGKGPVPSPSPDPRPGRVGPGPRAADFPRPPVALSGGAGPRAGGLVQADPAGPGGPLVGRRRLTWDEFDGFALEPGGWYQVRKKGEKRPW